MVSTMLKFRQYPLFWKLALPVVLVTLAWGAIISVTALSMKSSQARAHDLYKKNVTFVLQLQTLGQKFSYLNNLLLRHVSSADGKEIEVLRDKLHEQQAAVEADFNTLEINGPSSHEERFAEFVVVHKAYRQYTEKAADVMDLSGDFEKAAAFEKLQDLTSDFQRPINDALSRIITLEFDFMQRSYQQSQDIWRKNIITLAFTGGAAFLLTLVFLYWIIDGITRRMGLVAVCADTLSKGDLTARVEPDGCDDEISCLGRGLAIMAEEVDRSTILLQESEGQVRMLLDSTAEAIYGIDIEGKCTFSNRACLQLLGYESDAELLGQNIHKLIHHSYPDGSLYPVEECPVHRSILTAQEVHRDGEVLWRKDGSKFRVEYRSHPVQKDGEIVGAVISFLDITERKLTEEALQRSHNLLTEAQKVGHVGSWEWDIKNDTINWADETYRIFGFAPQEFMATYDLFLDRIHPEDREMVQHAVHEALDGKSYDINHRIFSADGAERVVNEKGKIEYDETGDPLFMIGTVQDITEIKKIENDLRTYQEKLEVLVSERTAELQAAKEEADNANQAKSLFLSSMSHELRTPLNSILGFSQLLFSDRKNPLIVTQKEHLQKVLKSGNHLLSLIDDVLNLSKIESGSMEISMEPVDSSSVLLDTIELVQEIAKAHHVEILGEGLDGHTLILADNTRFRQVLMNLLSNAIKYNRPGGTVSLACQKRDDRLRIIVSDTGSGISSEKCKLLFEPFTRLGAEASSIEGTGIGLTITKRLVQLMNGHIGYESEVGKGSKFWVDFPIVRGDEKGNIATSKPKLSTPSLPEGEYTVLYVEDNIYNRDLLFAILARTPSVKLLMAENSAQGVDMALQNKPDLILMDIGLPDMDGFATLNRLKEHEETRNIPVVALSGNAMPVDIEKALQSGFVEYITKPISVANLYQVLGRVINALSKQDVGKTT